MAINAGILTAIAAFLGVFFGSFIGPYINHKLNERYAKKDILFKRKLEYFEKISEIIENNIKTYKIAAKKIRSNIKDINKIVKELKKNRKNFQIKSSPLYFDISIISEKIRTFVHFEKKIFTEIEAINDEDDKLEAIEKDIRNLVAIGNKILETMRKELLS